MPKLQTCPFSMGDMVVTPSGEIGVVAEINFYHSWPKGMRVASCTLRVPPISRFARVWEHYTFVTLDANKLKKALTAEQVLGDDYFA